ncbi:MAG: hypothetical protein KDC26_08705 [Armatimonadetes bacterium]|nr:hypothetical protein [Armatimonadota bacterium]
MANAADVAANKMARQEFSKRNLDTTRADIRVTHGVCYVRGAVGTIKGGPSDVRAEVETIAKVLRTRQGIKDVVLDCTYRT